MRTAIFSAFVLSMLMAAFPLSAQEPAGGPHRKPGDSAVRDSTCLVSASLDSLRQHLIYNGSVRNDSIRLNSWRSLKDIAPAVKLAPLDGPDDIGEKVEIIEDRIDALLREKQKLETILDILVAARQSQEVRIEVLEDLSEINRESDMQLQQRLHDLQQQFNQLSRRIRAYERSLSALEGELARLRKLSKQYQRQARTMQKNEDHNQ